MPVVKKWAALASLLFLTLLFDFGRPIYGATYTSASPAASPFVLPLVELDSVLNGVQLITVDQKGTGSISVHVRVNSGALFDLAGKGGLADLTAGMLLKGGGGLSANNIADVVEQTGLTLSAAVGWDSTDVVVKGPADSLENIFDLLGKLVITPTFDQKELDALRAIRIADLKREAQDTSMLPQRKAIEGIFGSHPFGRSLRGSAESLAQVTRQDLTYFHKRFYIANGSDLIVSGDATPEEVTRLARSKLGAWKKGEKVPPTFRPPDTQSARRVFILDRAEEQGTQAVIAQTGVSRRAEDYF